MHISRILGISFFALATITGAQAQQLCQNSQLENFALYIYEPTVRCWSTVQHRGIGEGTIDLSTDFAGATKYKKRVVAQLLVAIESDPNYETGLVVKERIYNPRELSLEQGKPHDRTPTNQVSLERPAVSNRCGNWSALRSGASVDLNTYNRYHSSEYIRMSGDLRGFHYSYPRSPTDCRDTNDYSSSNRAQFAFSGLNVAPSSPLIAGFSFVSDTHAANPSYRRLKARNLFAKARQPTDPHPRFALISFQTSAQEFTRSEFTVADLEAMDNFGKHWPKTWQIEWVP
jgi:hypothetical protein